MKIIHWIIALCGLWEFGDIAALFVPGFGKIPAPLWNHIIVGLILMAAGTMAALSSSASANRATARKLDWIAASAGLWLVIASFLLGRPIESPGLWNDVIVGGLVFILAMWAALAPRRAAE